MSKIIVFQNEVLRQEVLLERDYYLIGRAPNNDIVLEQPEVSGFHAKISRDGEHYYIEDQSSRNGTFVDGGKIKRYRLKEGNIIAIGKFSLRFSAGGLSAATSTSAPETPKSGAEPVPEAKTQVVNITELTSTLEMHKRSAYMRSASQTSAGNARLVSMGANLQAQTYPVGRKPVTIGRAASCTVRTGGWFFTPAHIATVEWRDGGVYAVPHRGKSSVNNKPLTEPTLLMDGDSLKFGRLEMRFFS